MARTDPGARSVPCWIGLGSNLDKPRAQLQRAIDALAALPATELERLSPLYRSPPMGPQDQPWYLNAVARLRTGLAPLQLLDALQAIEDRQGRVRAERWGARTLDLDILIYDRLVEHSERLVLPHPGMRQRAFVLYPLQDIDPALEVPGLGAIAQLAAAVPADGLEKLDDGLESTGK